MKPITPSKIILSVVAAEVVFQALRAIADRQPAPAHPFNPAEEPKSRPAPARLLCVGVLQQLLGIVMRAFNCSFAGMGASHPSPKQTYRPRTGRAGITDHGELWTPDLDEVSRSGSRDALAEKLKDPAWAGVLAANDGNVSLTNAARAVPMPKTTQFVERLDRNPFVGMGMKDHSKGSH